jgi:hypothetical protein
LKNYKHGFEIDNFLYALIGEMMGLAGEKGKQEEEDYVKSPNVWAFPGPSTAFAFATGFEQGIFFGLNLDGPID